MKNSTKSDLPVALTLAGSDSGGGAGIQADLLTFAAHGVFGTTAITALTAQNPDGVSAVHPVPAEFVREQAEQVARYFKIGAAKTGMLATSEIIHAVADFFEAHREIKVVVDPVMIATSGAKLIDDAAIATLRERLIPLASLVTPNLDEAEVLLGEKFAWRANPKTQSGEISESAEKLAEALGVSVLLKGGHGNGDEVFDALAFPKAQGGFDSFVKHPRVAETNTHGSGCTLSAAIAANLAGSARENLSAAVSRAVDYVSAGISKPLPVAGDRFIAHL
ncbi:MAG: bifunctional hydroxymethylpyrimidine kinase/phosphomethylpyrimidine kinase [Opitutales bacterium]|nr:bifunctional hydroxymethylpyrimidine kinase/phosphomethylpyrimidine kinase [Opitutales bacterium]